ncbi:hypothetical protein GCM10008910_33130 [Faecalicatena orotica]|uniref:histidine kinase n=1 Tax=Faecalicatena orotica TaxID=1544 RepID=A0A2Y9C6A1_9FIRM|nr:HAMP domain-containing sensor histidine kinase [Faecalicatena orotica]PWJ23497.1 signal transduction histidine kinase [Faecalicatena orotica]SSA57759.1 Signal transduction histidine kinase [Faecalicatena orotica]
MKLSKKTFLYSIGISALLVSLIVIYFVTMLPSLYVDYMKKQNLKSVVEVEKGYMKNHSYKGLKVQNPTGSATLEIPLEGDEIYLAGKAFKFTVTVQDEQLKKLLGQVRNCFGNMKDVEKEDFEAIDWELLKKGFQKSALLDETAPVDVEVQIDKDTEVFKADDSVKMHIMDKDIVVFEGGASDEDNQYTTYIAIGRSGSSLIFSFLPVMTPQMKEIKPIVMGSIPMIAAVLFLIVMLCSQFFSKKIVNPVVSLAHYAEEVKNAGSLEVEPFKITARDEIGELGRTLNELYAKLKENYDELEEKNERLKKENKRQEVFLRASSHQLKTPVTAALLLVDGMIQEVGKYKDTKTYLPQVKEQLQSMRKIVEDILYLNHCTENLHIESVDVDVLLMEVMGAYRIQAEMKKLRFEKGGTTRTVPSDRELLKKILDNLFSNAVANTPENGQILVESEAGSVSIVNQGAHIDETLLPHLYEPFVSGSGKERGKGLGLYVSAYYSEVLGCKLTVENVSGGVRAKLNFTFKEDAQHLHTDFI